MDIAEKRRRQREATRRWRERNPDKVRELNRRPRQRIYDPVKAKIWRDKRLADPAYREMLNLQANIRATKLRRWLDAYKLGRGCVDCGFDSHPSALHFDHIKSNKKRNVSSSKSIAQAKKEINKCVVRCANCHAVKTWPNQLGHKSS